MCLKFKTRKAKMKQVNLRKVAIVGCGFVGAASAFALMQKGIWFL